MTLAGADGTPGACIEEDVLLYARPADVGARAVALPPHEVGQVAYSARQVSRRVVAVFGVVEGNADSASNAQRTLLCTRP